MYKTPEESVFRKKKKKTKRKDFTNIAENKSRRECKLAMMASLRFLHFMLSDIRFVDNMPFQVLCFRIRMIFNAIWIY